MYVKIHTCIYIHTRIYVRASRALDSLIAHDLGHKPLDDIIDTTLDIVLYALQTHKRTRTHIHAHDHTHRLCKHAHANIRAYVHQQTRTRSQIYAQPHKRTLGEPYPVFDMHVGVAILPKKNL